MTISTLSTRHHQTAELNMDQIFAQAANNENISFGMGLPDDAIFPSAALAEAFNQAIQQEGATIFQYHATQGPLSLRQKIATLTAEYFDFKPSPEHIILTQGGQQAIDIVGRAFLDKHDHIIVEAPTYMGALDAFDSYEPTYHEVALESDGLDMVQLEATLQQFPETKFVYTIPDFQNPTGVTMSLAKRQQLLALAEKYDFYVIEDSPYRYLRYSGTPLPSLAALDTHGRVILVSSFSKILSPALRTGWLVANPELTALFLTIKSTLDVQPSHLSLMAIDYFLSQHRMADHIATIIENYREKCWLMLDRLAADMPAEVTFTQPEGGFFIWVTLPDTMDATALLAGPVLTEGQVVYVPSEMQYASRQVKNHFRLNFTGVTTEQIHTGVARLGEILQRQCAAIQ
ncbi:PLP-dependent aminotransferase family protein [Leuconostoc holzapfelii]|uniref:PLP-dependent aminotransferase family protein n=1 Tax=Leuconostoc holzapfelii TaxID=434464 RepID=A0ABT2NWU5_9LACO|nr:PLP-dependent aminotransferase family protein [Leuconostoc holzapfelii]MCT8389843.1 PLP-dependent aminotransferase family protein [Leuconostoc holzapfelii]